MENTRPMIDTSENLLLIKGDISGIQEFIFNVKGEGAAKSLKAKSFFVKAISLISVHYLFSEFCVLKEDQERYTISISGGNFFILVPDQDKKDEIFAKYKRESVSSLSKIGLNIILTYVKIDTSSEYGKKLKELNTLNTIEKYRVFNGSDFNDVFKPFPGDSENHRLDFSVLNLNKRRSFILRPVQDNTLRISNSTIRFLQLELVMSDEEPENQFLSLKNKLDSFYPSAHGHILTFEDIAGQLGKTKKLGILKMDVDNLGSIFQNISNSEEHKNLSEKFRFFFEDKMYELINNQYNDCIYSIISGGDDCFFVGDWNAIIKLAIEINTQFNSFWKNSKHFQNGSIPTLSAGIIIVHSKFPVVRFAEMAEEALLQAKMKDFSKNRVSIFNTVIKWQDWKDIKDVKQKLENFVPKHAKSLLMNARKAVLNNNNIEKIELSDFWELAYHLREIRNQGKDYELNDILQVYEKYLHESIDGPEKDVRYRFFFPIAARLVELETRI